MKIAIADLHSHPTLRLYNGNKDIWYSDTDKNNKRKNKRKQNRKRNNNLLNVPEGEFYALAQSRVRLVFVSLYPVEQGFITNLAKHVDCLPNHPKTNSTINKLIGFYIKKYSNNLSLVDFVEKKLSKYLSGMSWKRFEEIKSGSHEYYDDLKKELNYLTEGAKTGNNKLINNKRYSLKIVSNYKELTEVLEIDENFNYKSENDNKIAIILTVEGGHSLGLGQENTKHLEIDLFNKLNQDDTFENQEVRELFEKVKDNIADMKKWGNNGSHCPFFMTFAHHFYNQLCGHNMSFPNFAHRVFDQINGMNTAITEFGKKVIYELLSVENGRRILIDTKHMSGDTKSWYYKYIGDYNRINAKKIPIISSHSAVSGNKLIAEQNSNNHNTMDEDYKNCSNEFNIWDINLSDEEIKLIHESEGIIGLNLDQRILSGSKMLDEIRQNTEGLHNNIDYQLNWAEPLLKNILHIIEVIAKSDNNNKNYVLDMIAIGSDYDGMINPLDAYCFAEDLESLRNILILKFMPEISTNPFMKNVNVFEFVDSIMFKNAVKFLKNNFNY